MLNKQGVEFEPGKLGRFASSITQPLVIDGLQVVLWLAQIGLRDTTAADSSHVT